MFDNFDPKEKKAILIFFALLILGVAYIYTHDLPWDQQQFHNSGDVRGESGRDGNQTRSYRR